MRIAFVENSAQLIKIVVRCINTIKEHAVCQYKIFSNSFHLLEELENNAIYDIYLLDIDMLQMEGITLAKNIRKNQYPAYIIFLSSEGKYAVEGYSFQIRAFHYILNSNIHDQLPKVLKIIQEKIENRDEGYFTVSSQEGTFCLKKKDIIYVCKEKNSKNILFVTRNSEYKKRGTLKDAMKILGDAEFLMAGKGYIVNIMQVRSMKGNQISFGDKVIYVSNHCHMEIKKKFIEYWKDRDNNV